MTYTIGLKSFAAAASAAACALVLGACGGSNNTPTPSVAQAPQASAIPSQSFGSHPTFQSTGYALGDTNANPDSQFECGASGHSDDGTVIAYATVAGNSKSEADQVCSALESSNAWTSVTTISGGSYSTTPVCHITTADTNTTIRIYTAKPDGTDSLTTQLCSAMAQGFGAG
jgi:hypothetical protein